MYCFAVIFFIPSTHILAKQSTWIHRLRPGTGIDPAGIITAGRVAGIVSSAAIAGIFPCATSVILDRVIYPVNSSSARSSSRIAAKSLKPGVNLATGCAATAGHAFRLCSGECIPVAAAFYGVIVHPKIIGARVALLLNIAATPGIAAGIATPALAAATGIPTAVIIIYLLRNLAQNIRHLPHGLAPIIATAALWGILRLLLIHALITVPSITTGAIAAYLFTAAIPSRNSSRISRTICSRYLRIGTGAASRHSIIEFIAVVAIAKRLATPRIPARGCLAILRTIGAAYVIIFFCRTGT